MVRWPTEIPKWITEAFSNLGTTEIPGKQHNKKILNWLLSLKAWWSEDETPWCGTFVAHCLQIAGITPPKNWFRAKEYALYGTPCNKTSIPFGAICVKSRVGGGHVFFAVARDSSGTIIYGLGGNQRNKVSIVPFKLTDIDAVRWPGGEVTGLPVAVSASDIGASPPGSEA